MVESIARKQSITRLVSLHASLDAHVRAKHDLDNIVKELERIETRYFRQELH